MIKINVENSLNYDKIYFFLEQSNYKKFNLWPNVTREKVTEYLMKEIAIIHKTGKNIYC